MANSANTATACIQAHGELLVREVLRAVAVSCPQRLMRSLAILLHGLFNHPAFGPAARKWFTQCMSDDKVLGPCRQPNPGENVLCAYPVLI